MRRLTSILLVAFLCVTLVNGQNIPNFKDPANLSNILKGLYGKSKDHINVAGHPIEPSVVVNYLLKFYCQLLREQGVTNLPDYCYTVEQTRVTSNHHRDIASPIHGNVV